MPKRKPRVHLEIQTSRKSPVGILRTTFWDKELKKYRHTQLTRVTGKSLDELKIIQAAFRGDATLLDSPEATQCTQSREYGASHTILQIAKKLELPRILYSRNQPWVQSALAMMTGRIVYQGSKLSLCNLWEETSLWELCGIQGRPDVQAHCYDPMDELLKRKKSIQKKLAKKHLKQTSAAETIILYDITSTYFEGEYAQSKLVAYGYNRDRKKGTQQVVIGLICTAEGCPIGVEIFKGNTTDASTVMDKIKEIRDQYGIKKCTFVGDRGMLTEKNLDQLKDDKDLLSVTALTHGNLKKLLKENVIQLELFDETNIVEVSDPTTPETRYCLCKNPHTEAQVASTRKRLIALTEKELSEIAAYQRACTVEKLGARVGKVLQKYKMGKFIHWHVEADPTGTSSSRKHLLKWTLDEEKIRKESQLDGCYIITTNVPKETMGSQQVVETYKALGNVERAFRNIKTVALEVRPVHHKTDKRIEAHIFICMLAYYVQWHMHKALKPLYEADGQGSNREKTFAGVIETLKSQRQNTMTSNGIQYTQITTPTSKQSEIIELLTKTI